MGKRHYPIYKIVAADSRSPRDGRFIEAVGTYNPNLEPMQISLKESRVKYWLNVGAQPTDTVRSLLRNEGLLLKIRLEKKGSDAEKIESEFQKFLLERDSKLTRLKERKARRKLNKKSKKEDKKEGGEPAAAAEQPAE